MKRKALIRGLLGFPEGIAIGMGITILISLAIRDGSYHPCVPSFVSVAGSEIAAVIIQTLLCGLLGSIYGAASVIWDMDSWSIAKQSGVFFAVAAVAMMSIGYILHWMDHSASGILSFFLVFFAVFVVIWLDSFLYQLKIRRIMSFKESIHLSSIARRLQFFEFLKGLVRLLVQPHFGQQIPGTLIKAPFTKRSLFHICH